MTSSKEREGARDENSDVTPGGAAHDFKDFEKILKILKTKIPPCNPMNMVSVILLILMKKGYIRVPELQSGVLFLAKMIEELQDKKIIVPNMKVDKSIIEG